MLKIHPIYSSKISRLLSIILSDYKVTLPIALVHPQNLPKKLIELGKFDNCFYKLPDWYIKRQKYHANMLL